MMFTHRRIDLNVDVEPLQAALRQHNYLFDEFTFRKDDSRSPHVEMKDIIFRYNGREHYQKNREKFNQEHDAVWYDSAQIAPEVKDIVFKVMAKVKGERLGMVLCTKLGPGKKIASHVDSGWHAEFYKKYYVAIENKPGSVFYFTDGEIKAKEGEVYEFDNALPHGVNNNSTADRIALIVCIKGDS